MSAPPSAPGRGLPQAHLFGVFAPAMAPERRAALFAALAAAFPE